MRQVRGEDVVEAPRVAAQVGAKHCGIAWKVRVGACDGVVRCRPGTVINGAGSGQWDEEFAHAPRPGMILMVTAFAHDHVAAAIQATSQQHPVVPVVQIQREALLAFHQQHRCGNLPPVTPLGQRDVPSGLFRVGLGQVD